MIVHQRHNSQGNHHYNAFFYSNCEWFYHFHKNFELIYVLEGEVDLTLNNAKHLLSAENFALILPNEFHAYHTPDHSLAWVGVFSSDFVSEFDRLTHNQCAQMPVFTCEANIRAFLLHYLISENPPDTLLLKSALYAVCREFLCKAQLYEKTNETSFIYDILSYVSQNYQEDISLNTIAKTFGYEYHYLSRHFHTHFHINFKQFLNMYRADFARDQLLHTDMDISKIAHISGFQTIRTFNRVFREQTGMTPSEFRHKLRQTEQGP